MNSEQRARKFLNKCLIIVWIFSLLAACKSAPQVDGVPARLEFEYIATEVPARLESGSIEAANTNSVVLQFRLIVDNPRPQDMRLEIKNWRGLLNGRIIDENSASLILDGSDAVGTRFDIGPSSSIEKELVLHLDLTPVDGNECVAELSIYFDCHYDQNAPLQGEVSANIEFPRVLEPLFSITSIVIEQADLINTRFRCILQIDNPNIFPLTIFSLRYVLYGDGRLWGGGRERDLAVIPAQSSLPTSFSFEMNFIGMPRSLLDDIIAMQHVRYRFTGEAEIGIDMPNLPAYHMNFDLSGNSEVKE